MNDEFKQQADLTIQAGRSEVAKIESNISPAEQVAKEEAARVLKAATDSGVLPRESELLAMMDGLKASEVVRSVDLAGDPFATLATTYDQAEAAIVTHFDAAPVMRDATMRDALIALITANRSLLALVKDMHLRGIRR
jgi:hypothetical protein